MANNNPLRDWLVIGAFFVVLTVLTTITVVYANRAQQEASEVKKELKELNVTAQNRCMVQVVLSFPPPVQEEQFDTVLQQFDECIVRETGRENSG